MSEAWEFFEEHRRSLENDLIKRGDSPSKAHDVVSEVGLKFARKAQTLDRKVWTKYLYVSSLNTSIDVFRKERPDTVLSVHGLADALHDFLYDDSSESAIREIELRDFLRTVPAQDERCYQIIELLADGLSHEEISKKVGLSVVAVKSRKYRFQERAREMAV